MSIKLVKYRDKYAEMHGQQYDKYTEMHGQQNDKYTEMNGHQNDKYTEMHGQQNDKYTDMHGQQNIKKWIFMSRFIWPWTNKKEIFPYASQKDTRLGGDGGGICLF